jgi:hypothetical protein
MLLDPPLALIRYLDTPSSPHLLGGMAIEKVIVSIPLCCSVFSQSLNIDRSLI